MASTTNYGWTTPDDTGLVKDGASAMRSLGTSIDTTVKALNPGTTSGDLDYYTSSTTKSRLAKGTAGQVLAMNSGATAPEWQTIAAGSLTLISETTASGLSSLSLSSIPSSYKNLLITWDGITTSNDSTEFSFRLNNDSSSIYTINRIGGNGTGGGGTFGMYNSASNDNIGTNWVGFAVRSSNTDWDKNSRGQLFIENYASTTKYKRFQLNMKTYQQAYSEFCSQDILGLYRSTSAITSIDVYRSLGSGTFSNASNTSIRLYGVN